MVPQHYLDARISLFARHLRGDAWQWLSIAPGKSAEYDVTKNGATYDVEGKPGR